MVVLQTRCLFYLDNPVVIPLLRAFITILPSSSAISPRKLDGLERYSVTAWFTLVLIKSELFEIIWNL